MNWLNEKDYEELCKACLLDEKNEDNKKSYIKCLELIDVFERSFHRVVNDFKNINSQTGLITPLEYFPIKELPFKKTKTFGDNLPNLENFNLIIKHV